MMPSAGKIMNRPVAVYTDIDNTDITPGIKLLEDSGFEVRVLGTRDPQEIIAGAQGAEALLPGYSEVTREVIEALPQLRIIALMSMGTNTVDLRAAKEHSIWVTNILGRATEEVGTHTLAIILAMLRQLDYYQANANPTRWNLRAENPPPRLSELTLGIVGLGRTGQELARVAAPLFNEIIGYDPIQQSNLATGLNLPSIARMPLDDLIGTADALSLHLPLTPSTESLVDTGFLNKMKPCSYLVNASRGGLIDENALATALDQGHLAGAALDVLSEEPPPLNHPLVGRPDVVLTPHIAYYSAHTVTDYVETQARNVVAFRKHGRPLSPAQEVQT